MSEHHLRLIASESYRSLVACVERSVVGESAIRYTETFLGTFVFLCVSITPDHPVLLVVLIDHVPFVIQSRTQIKIPRDT